MNSNNFLCIEDDGSSKLKFFYTDVNNKKVYVSDVTGTIDYSKGTITLNDLTIAELENSADSLKIRLSPKDQDIFPKRNQILTIDLQETTINMMPDTDDYNNNYDITTQNVSIIRR